MENIHGTRWVLAAGLLSFVAHRVGTSLGGNVVGAALVAALVVGILLGSWSERSGHVTYDDALDRIRDMRDEIRELSQPVGVTRSMN